MDDRHLRFAACAPRGGNRTAFGENQVIDDLLRDLGMLELALAEKYREGETRPHRRRKRRIRPSGDHAHQKDGTQGPGGCRGARLRQHQVVEYIYPSLSTIDIQKESIGASAARRSFDRLQGKE
jgi:hypothetical protein